VKLQLLPWFSAKKINLRHLLPLLCAAVLCVAPTLAYGQSVTFLGVQTVPQLDFLNPPDRIAVDAAGDIFVHTPFQNTVQEFPKIPSGHGSPIEVYTQPNLGSVPSGISLDRTGNLFVAEGDFVDDAFYAAEIPWNGTAYGSQIKLSVGGPDIATDGAGNLFLTAQANPAAPVSIIELPKTGDTYGAPINLLTSLVVNPSIALDGAGDIFWRVPLPLKGATW
jgi:hypothetical protein